MPRNRYRSLFGIALLLVSVGSAAEPSKTGTATEWQVGKTFAPKRTENVHLSPSTNVRMSAGTELEVQSQVTLPAGADGLLPHAASAQLTQGRVDVTVDLKKRPAQGVMIHGPRRTSVLARGGHVAVAANATGVAIGVYDGKEASVGIGSAWKLIPAGNVLVVSARTPLGMERKLLRPPTQVVVDRPALALEGAAEPTQATWAPVQGAQRYHLELVNTATNKRHRLESNQPSAALAGLGAGKYSLKVSAADEFGIDGPQSEPVTVQIVGVELPPGAFVAQRRLFIEPTQQITLSNIDGLEATYNTTSVYFKASSIVGLRGGKTTTLHLRLPGSVERTSLEIAPRALHTAVEILPGDARWPRDKVLVRIGLPSQGADAPPIEVIPTVTVNNQPVAVGWMRSADALEAVIPAPPVYPGPWILRAVVSDQHGIVLGRNFLEIASMAGVDDQDIPREIHRK